jgi:hypothetical protein
MSPTTTSAYPILSKPRIALISAISGLMTGAIVLLSQWLVYDDWLHRSDPLRIIGTVVSGILTFLFVHRWQSLQRQRQMETVKRFERIAFMNDRIRNSLQAIECVTFVAQPQATEAVQDAVNAIDRVLGEVLEEMNPSANSNQSEPGSKSQSMMASNS